MKVKELLTEGLDKKGTYTILLDFIRFAAEHLELKQLPKFEFLFDTSRSLEHKSFGGYSTDKHINITVVNRHIMDVCRTLAHELVHFKQDLNDQLTGENPGATGSPQENEANAEAAVIMRNWGKKHPDLFDKESISEGINLSEATSGVKMPLFSGWLAVSYERENAPKKFPSNVKHKQGVDLNNTIGHDDINDIEFTDDEIGLKIAQKLKNIRLRSEGGGAGQGFNEHFYGYVGDSRGFRNAIEGPGKSIVLGSKYITEFFQDYNASLRKIGLPEYTFSVWGGIISPRWKNPATADVIANIQQLSDIIYNGAQIGDFWNQGRVVPPRRRGVAENKEFLDKPTPSAADIIAKHGMSEIDFMNQMRMGVKSELEHTSNVKIAIEIALDHLNEFPDYYTRLQQAER